MGTSSSKTEQPSKSTSDSKASDISLLNAASQALKEALEDTDDDDLTTSEVLLQDGGGKSSEFWWMEPKMQRALGDEQEKSDGNETPTQAVSPVKDTTSWLKQSESVNEELSDHDNNTLDRPVSLLARLLLNSLFKPSRMDIGR